MSNTENNTDAKKKTAADILIARFLEDVDEQGFLPWQKPYQTFNAFNWVSKEPYRGFNRFILPFGEYLTKNQINQINKEKGEDYRFQKGIKWYPIAYFTRDARDISAEEVTKAAEEAGKEVDLNVEGFLFTNGYWTYYRHENSFQKRRNVLKYYEVADRKFFVNSKGECLPSRIETGEVEITFSEPMDVLNNYINRSGVKLVKDYADVPCYIPMLDQICLNPYSKDQESWFSTAFHEAAHSTGAKKRLNRVGIVGGGRDNDIKLTAEEKKSRYAVEECIAEIAASLCCAECNIATFETSESQSYQNSISYVQSWRKRIQDWGKEFIYIVSQAEKAFNYIMDDDTL